MAHSEGLSQDRLSNLKRDEQADHLRHGLKRFFASGVAPGVGVIPLPFPSPLGYSFSYALEVETGIVLVDLGWDSDDNWVRLQKGLQRLGSALDDVVGVVITHVHPDHFGLASRVLEQTSAWVAAHEAEVPMIAAGSDEADKRFADMFSWIEACGVPRAELDSLESESADVIAAMPRVTVTRTLADGEAIPGTGGALVAVHTPGHTPGHLCFHDRDRSLLFTGDHLLPRVSPNVSKRPQNGDYPLADYHHSLLKVAQIEGRVMVLPGHEWMFDRPEARVAELLAHHQARLDEVLRVVETGAQTVWEVAQRLTWARDFDSFNPRARRQALGEAHSHLDHLVQGGALIRADGSPLRWDVPT